VSGVTTVTGHTLRANPFGQINVVGTNGTMLVKITKAGQIGYGWFLLLDLNQAYWAGNTSTATVAIKSTIPGVPRDTTGPTVTITSPLNGGTVPKNKTTTVKVTASDASGIQKVEFYLDTAKKASDFSSPYSAGIYIGTGQHTLKVIAYDKVGNTATTSVTVTAQ
jgi:hypothetical protein